MSYYFVSEVYYNFVTQILKFVAFEFANNVIESFNAEWLIEKSQEMPR